MDQPRRQVLRIGSGWGWVVAAASLLIFAGCTTARGMGVRTDYRGQSIDAAAVWPFYAATSFELNDETRRRVLDTAQASATEWLAERLGEVTPPSSLTGRLVSSAGDQASSDDQSASAQAEQSRSNSSANNSVFPEFEVDLEQRYVPAERHRPSETARKLMAWHKQGQLDETYVLFGRVIYHTETTCRVRADDHYARADVVVHPDVDDNLPNPCIVTHLQTKLVDADAGATVWFNQGLREYHVPEITADRVRDNVTRLTTRLLGGEDGLVEMLGGR